MLFERIYSAKSLSASAMAASSAEKGVPDSCILFGSKGEYGWDGWLGTYFANLPEEKITFLMNENVTNTGTAGVIRKCRNILASELSLE